MVYSKKIVKINVGDTIFWKAKTKGHNVEFIKGGVPDGVEKFKSKFNKDAVYKFTVPGIYAYWCTPHKNMGMIGFVVVDNDTSNLEQIKKIRFNAKSKKIAPELISSLQFQYLKKIKSLLYELRKLPNGTFINLANKGGYYDK